MSETSGFKSTGDEFQKVDSKKSAGFLTLPQWNDWQWQVRNQIKNSSELEKWISLTVEEKRAIQFSQGRFHFSLTPYWASLMDSEKFFYPIRRQTIPLDAEFRTGVYDHSDFTLHQARFANGRLIHSYADRVILSVHSQCIVYCRFCPQRQISEKNCASG